MKRQQKVELLSELFETLVGETADVFVLFVDLCGSTKFKQYCISSDIPDSTWICRQLIFLQRAAKIIRQYKGEVVKTIGDEIFAYFGITAEPEGVLKCAIEIIQGFGNFKPYKGGSRIVAKASIDFGLTYNGSITDSTPFDPIGLPVDRCARLNSLAKRNEILFSKDFLSVAEEKSSAREFKVKYGYNVYLSDIEGIGKTEYFSILAE